MKKLKRSSNAAVATVGEELLLLDVDTGVYYAMNRTGVLLWERLSIPADEAELAAVLGENFAISEEVAVADVASWVAELEANGLVTRG